MSNREGAAHPDAVAASVVDHTPLAGLDVRIWSTASWTYLEVWQSPLGAHSGRTMVFSSRHRRLGDNKPDVAVMAAYLARRVSGFDREGWEMLR